MKKIIFNKLLLDCLFFFTIILISLSLIIWVFQAVSYLDIIIEDGRDYLIYLQYALANLPKIISKLIPFSVFLAFFYTLTKYETHNELLILWNFGVNKKNLIFFIMKFSIFFFIVQISLTTLIVPKSQDYARSIIRDSQTKKLENFLKPKKFNDLIKGLTIYSEKKDPNGNLINIYLKKENNNDDFQITYAKKGLLKNINESQILILIDGQTLNFINKKITSFTFSRSEFNMSDLETNSTTYSKTQEISTLSLYKCILQIKKNIEKINIKNCSNKNFANIQKELYKRIYIPIYIPLLILITLFILVYSKEEVNYFKFKSLILFLGFIIIIFSEISIRFIEMEIYKNLKLLLIPILIFILIIKLINFKLNIPKKIK